jgi:hypothetical protein
MLATAIPNLADEVKLREDVYSNVKKLLTPYFI